MQVVTHTRSALAGLASALVLILTGCSGTAQQTEDKAQPADEIMILCGTSFAAPVEALARQYEAATGRKVTLSMGGSEDLLPQVKTHAAGDLFVTHDPYMAETERAGAMLRWVQVGDLAPALVVPKGNPQKIERLEDLARPGLKVIVPNPEFATCGQMLMSLLDKKGLKDAVMANVGNRLFRSHSEIGNNMKLGMGDAGIMWNGVAHNFLDALELVPTPYEYDTETRVGVIGLSYSQNKELVEQFLKYVEEHGQQVFAEFGYVKEVKAQ
jgi:molybdate transport system substrate-binding protein